MVIKPGKHVIQPQQHHHNIHGWHGHCLKGNQWWEVVPRFKKNAHMVCKMLKDVFSFTVCLFRFSIESQVEISVVKTTDQAVFPGIPSLGIETLRSAQSITTPQLHGPKTVQITLKKAWFLRGVE